MNEAAEKVLKIFIQLVNVYLSRQITGSEFEAQYLELWRKYRDTREHLEINSATEGSIDRIFVSLDCFCSCPQLRDDGDLDDEKLFEEVRAVAENLISTRNLD